MIAPIAAAARDLAAALDSPERLALFLAAPAEFLDLAEAEQGREPDPPPVPARRAIDAGRVRIDPATRAVTVDGRPVEELSRREYQLLVALATEPGRVWSKTELLADAFDYGSAAAHVTTRTVDTYASRLRVKLRAAADDPAPVLQNVWGVGYRVAA